MESVILDPDLPAVFQPFSLIASTNEEAEALHCGALCPMCGEGRLDYDGLLNLSCAACGYNTGGGGGCT